MKVSNSRLCHNWQCLQLIMLPLVGVSRSDTRPDTASAASAPPTADTARGWQDGVRDPKPTTQCNIDCTQNPTIGERRADNLKKHFLSEWKIGPLHVASKSAAETHYSVVRSSEGNGLGSVLSLDFDPDFRKYTPPSLGNTPQHLGPPPTHPPSVLPCKK